MERQEAEQKKKNPGSKRVPRKPEKKRKLDQVVSWICSVLIVLMVGLIGYLGYCNATGSVAFFGNTAALRILSPSMEPTIPTGEYILVRRLSAAEAKAVQPGTVIVFRSREAEIYGKLNTHRVIEVTAAGTYVTKGDHNPGADAKETQPADVVGVYERNLPGLTAAAGIFTQRWVFFLVILIPAAVLLMLCIRNFRRKVREVHMAALVEEKLKELESAGGLKGQNKTTQETEETAEQTSALATEKETPMMRQEQNESEPQ